jgi:hypothetical protein
MERELDHRSGDGIDVTLLWDADADVVLVAVENEHTGECFRIAVDGADALEAFRHPYAYERGCDTVPESVTSISSDRAA